MDKKHAATTRHIAAQRRRLLRMLGRGMLGLAALPLLDACTIVTSQQRFAVMMSGPGPGQYAPSNITVPLGATVVWKNLGTNPQTATCDPARAQQGQFAVLPPGAQPWDSGLLYTGQTWAHTFDKPGEYVYFSQPDRSVACSARLWCGGSIDRGHYCAPGLRCHIAGREWVE